MREEGPWHTGRRVMAALPILGSERGRRTEVRILMAHIPRANGAPHSICINHMYVNVLMHVSLYVLKFYALYVY